MGGTISEVTGGKFKNGAASAAFYSTIRQDWGSKAFGDSDGTNIALELEGLSAEQKAENLKINLAIFKKGLQAAGDALALEVTSRVLIVDKSSIGNSLSAVFCSTLFRCGEYVYVSEEYLQTGRGAYDFLDTAYHEVLHFNDSRWNIMRRTPQRHDEIYRLAGLVHTTSARVAAIGKSGYMNAFKVASRFDELMGL
jgi:hypothetical protein